MFYGNEGWHNGNQFREWNQGMEIEFLSRQIISISQSSVLEKVGNLVILMLYSSVSYSGYGLVTGLPE